MITFAWIAYLAWEKALYLCAGLLASAVHEDGAPDADPRAIGWWLLCLGAVLWIWNQVREALRGDKPTAIKQPIQIEHVAQFVSVDQFNAKFDEIDTRFLALESQIKAQIQSTDKYLHEMRHEMRGEMQSTRLAIDESKQIAQSSTSKAHARIDDLAESLGEVRGQLAGVDDCVKEIRTLILQKGLES